MSKLLIIDGNSLINRAYHGVPLLYAKNGVPTNAINGFIKMVHSLLDSEQPTHFAVCFDVSGPVFRHSVYSAYKANRKGMDEELRVQMPLIKEALGYMNVPMVELSGYEGDDLIGTLTALAEKEAYDVVVVSGDRDTFQLISDKTTVIYPKKGLKNVLRMTPELLDELYELKPHEVIELKALMGDSSDNIPGVSGIGETYAKRFIKQYGSVENLYANIADFSGKKLGEKLLLGQDMAILSKDLATIKRDVPLDILLDDLVIKEADKDKLLAFYDEYEMNQLKKTLALKSDVKKEELLYVENQIRDFEMLEKHLFDSEKKLLVFGLADDKKTLYYAFDDKALYRYSFYDDKAQVFHLLLRWQKENDGVFYVEDRKAIYRSFKEAVSKMPDIALDFVLADYLIHAEDKARDLLVASNTYLDDVVESLSDKDKVILLVKIMPILKGKLEEKHLSKLYHDIEAPLARVLVLMEDNGIALDKPYLEALKEELGERLASIETEIYAIAGEPFNINSPKQLGEILFEKMNLPVIKKTKTGYSTNVEVLEALQGESEIIAPILAYRQLAKLKSTYVDGLLNLIDTKGRVHTTFNQTITATGRLSSTEPNLQNIPIRTAEGRRIRKAFVPLQEEHVLVSADYSQIELRILAHMSGDETLVESFKKGEDIHKRTASEVFHVPLELVTKDMRRAAKAVNFGIIYGQTDFGLSKELGISRNEAKNYITSYFEHYASVSDFLQEMIAKARLEGYAVTMFDRKREIREISSKNFVKRSFAERTAVNTPIQGSAADIIKLAMLECQRLLEKEGFKAKMLLQVHDELVFDVPPKELGFLVQKIKEAMVNVVALDVPLEVDIKVGFNWEEMESIG